MFVEDSSTMKQAKYADLDLFSFIVFWDTVSIFNIYQKGAH